MAATPQDIARLGIGIDTAQVTAAVTALDTLKDTAVSTEVATTALVAAGKEQATQSTRVAQEAQRQTREVNDVRQAYVALRASIDPVFQAQQRLSQAEETVRRARQAGLISAKDESDMLRRLQTEFRQTADATEHLAQSARRFDMRGMSMQLSQVAQMGAVTGNWVQSLTIQLPDMLLAFGTGGAIIGAFAAVLAPLAMNLLPEFEDETEKAKAAQDNFNAAIEGFKGYAEIASQSSEQLRAQYGAFADAVLNDARRLMAFNAQQIVANVVGATSPIQTALEDAFDAYEDYQNRIESVNQRVAAQGGIVGSQDIEDLKAGYQQFLQLLDAADLTANQFYAVRDALDGIKEAGDADLPTVLARLTALRDSLESAFSGKQMPSDLRDLFDELNSQITSLRAGIDDLNQAQVNQVTDALGTFATKANDIGLGIQDILVKLGVMDESSLGTITSGFESLVERAAKFLGLVGDISSLTGGTAADYAAGFNRLEGTPTGDYNRDLAQAIAFYAEKYQVTPEQLASVISYETAGSFNPAKEGPGGHVGLYQAGAAERAQYGYDPYSGNAFEQMASLDRYLWDRNFRPGMGIANLYSTINAGQPGRMGASDVYNGAGGDINNPTVADKVAEILTGAHAARGQGFWQAYGPSATAASVADQAFIGQLGVAINAGEAAQIAARPTARPPVRPFNFNPSLAQQGFTGPTPQVRPPMVDEGYLQAQVEARKDAADAAEKEADKYKEVEDALNALQGTYDESVDIQKQMADAKEIVADAVDREIISYQEGQKILAQYNQYLIENSQASKDAAKASEDAAKVVQDAWQEAGDQIGDAFAAVIVRGESFREVFGNLLAQIASDILSSGISDAIMTAFAPQGYQGSGSIGDIVMQAFGGWGSATAGGVGTSAALGGGAASLSTVTGGGIAVYEGGGYTGSGARMGGIDGRGGYLSVVHPDEYIEDLRQTGRSAGGGDTYYVDMTGTYGDDALMRKFTAIVESNNRRQNKAMPDKVQYIRKRPRER